MYPITCGVDKKLSRQIHALEIVGANPTSRNLTVKIVVIRLTIGVALRELMRSTE